MSYLNKMSNGFNILRIKFSKSKLVKTILFLYFPITKAWQVYDKVPATSPNVLSSTIVKPTLLTQICHKGVGSKDPVKT